MHHYSIDASMLKLIAHSRLAARELQPIHHLPPYVGLSVLYWPTRPTRPDLNFYFVVPCCSFVSPLLLLVPSLFFCSSFIVPHCSFIVLSLFLRWSFVVPLFFLHCCFVIHCCSLIVFCCSFVFPLLFKNKKCGKAQTEYRYEYAKVCFFLIKMLFPNCKSLYFVVVPSGEKPNTWADYNGMVSHLI